jgi:DNA-binding NtrC family response regulator
VLLIADSREKLAEAARALHERSGRAARPFVEFDCTSRDAEAVENLLFGGPTYGVTARAAVHEAGTGTLHVSAIDALPVLVQPRFLRFLDATDRPRVVVSTSADLRELTKIGTMRADLSERLLLVHVRLPGAP